MTIPSAPRMRLPRIGWVQQLILGAALTLCTFWLSLPADASMRWKKPNRQGFAHTPDKSIALLGDSSIQFYDVQDLTLTHTLPIAAGNIVYSPNSHMIATQPPKSSGLQPVRIYRASDGVLLHQLDEVVDSQSVWIVWSPDSRFLAVRYIVPGNYVYWDSATGMQIKPPLWQPPDVAGMAYSNDGQVLFLSTPDTLIALRTSDGLELYRRPLPSSQITLTPNGSVLLGYERGNIRAFNASDGTPLWELGADDTDQNRSLRFVEVSTLAISPDSQYIVVGEMTSPGFFFGWEETAELVLIRATDGIIVHRYRGQTRGIISIIFAPDSQTFLSSNGEEIARWKVETRQPWLIWLPATGMVLLLIHGVLQLIWNRRTHS